MSATANLPLGAADASVIAVAERLRIRQILTLDRAHFSIVRPNHIDAFDLASLSHRRTVIDKSRSEITIVNGERSRHRGLDVSGGLVGDEPRVSPPPQQAEKNFVKAKLPADGHSGRHRHPS